MITKKVYEEYYRYHDFRRRSVGGCLNDNESITNVIVKVVSVDDESIEYTGMVDNVSAQGTKAIYRLKGGEKGRMYRIIIRIETSNGQRFENQEPIYLVVE